MVRDKTSPFQMCSAVTEHSAVRLSRQSKPAVIIEVKAMAIDLCRPQASLMLQSLYMKAIDQSIYVVDNSCHRDECRLRRAPGPYSTQCPVSDQAAQKLRR